MYHVWVKASGNFGIRRKCVHQLDIFGRFFREFLLESRLMNTQPSTCLGNKRKLKEKMKARCTGVSITVFVQILY